MADFCSITDALAEAQYNILRKLNNRFEALRRLMEILEQLGDLKAFIPNIASLIPVVDIDLDAYTNLRSNCPFLNLPAVDETNLEALRRQVIDAYNSLTADALNHQWLRMGKLQDALSRAQGQLNAAFAQGAQYIQCLQAACATAQSAEGFLNRVGSTNVTAELARFEQNFVTEGGRVLTAPAQAKYEQAVRALDTMAELGATNVPQSYRDTAAQLATAQTSAIVVEETANPVVNITTTTPFIVP